jgi:hypothetical protein
MAFRQPAPPPRQHYVSQPDQEEFTSTSFPNLDDRTEESQQWILFSPSQTASATTGTQTSGTPATAGLSRISDFGSLAARPGQAAQNSLDEDFTEDGELDSLDEGLQAFREPSIYRSSSNQAYGAVLPTHDGLGTFPASSTLVQEQLWQHEQYNPKRKYEGTHGEWSSVQRRLDTIEELDVQIGEEKRMRIEQWRMDQSQAFLDEVEKETRKRERRSSIAKQSTNSTNLGAGDGTFGITAHYGATSDPANQEIEEVEPFWRRMTRKFVRDVIGIDEPLLSVIVGETLPEDIYAIANLADDPQASPGRYQQSSPEETWPDRLLRHIARELGILVNNFSPHPGAFAATSSSSTNDYAGIPVPQQLDRKPKASQHSNNESTSKLTPLFSPTMQGPSNSASWGLEDETPPESSDAEAQADNAAERLRREREYWERELDIKMVFHFLKGRFSSNSPSRRPETPYHPAATRDDSVKRADVIRRHHPLVASSQQPSIARLRGNSTLRSWKRSASSCVTESVRSCRRPSIARSGGSSRNYWDIGGSVGSGSAFASGGMMGVWGEV